MHAVICRGHMFLEASSPLDSCVWVFFFKGEAFLDIKKKKKQIKKVCL